MISLRKIKPMKKKAQSFFDIIILIVIGIVVLLFFAGWKYGFHLITTELENVQTPTNDLGINISNISTQTFGKVDQGLNGLNLLAFAIFFGMALSILLSNFLIKVHPAFFIVYILVAIIAVVLSFYVSNFYQELMTNDVLGPTLTGTFTIMTYVMMYLPLWITIIGFLGAIFLFSGMIRDTGQGGGLG